MAVLGGGGSGPNEYNAAAPRQTPPNGSPAPGAPQGPGAAPIALAMPGRPAWHRQMGRARAPAPTCRPAQGPCTGGCTSPGAGGRGLSGGPRIAALCWRRTVAAARVASRRGNAKQGPGWDELEEQEQRPESAAFSGVGPLTEGHTLQQ